MGSQLTEDTGPRTPKAAWSKELIHIFCDICIHAIDKGMRPKTHFNKQGWRYIGSEFFKQTGMNYQRLQLKNKWDSLKKEWKLWKDLVGKEKGLGWDRVKGTIAASEEWWIEKIKVNPNFRNFRQAGIERELCDKLDAMFLNTVVTGESAVTPSANDVLLNHHDDNTTHTTERVHFREISDSDEGNFDYSLDGLFNGSTTRRKRARHSSFNNDNGRSNKKGKRHSERVVLEDLIRSLVVAVSSTVSGTSKQRDLPGCSMGEVMEDMRSLPNIEEGSDLFIFAMEFLETPIKREQYHHLSSPAAKEKWLNHHYNKAKNQI